MHLYNAEIQKAEYRVKKVYSVKKVEGNSVQEAMSSGESETESDSENYSLQRVKVTSEAKRDNPPEMSSIPPISSVMDDDSSIISDNSLNNCQYSISFQNSSEELEDSNIQSTPDQSLMEAAPTIRRSTRNLGVYVLHEHTIRTIKSRYEKSGRSLKYFVPAIGQGETTTKNISTFKKTLIESLRPGRHRLVNATCHPTFGIELKADSIIMDTLFELTEDEKKMRTNFFSSPTFTISEASSLANCTRLCLGPVQVKSIGETSVVSTGSRRREVQLAMEDISALLTLWGKDTDLEVVTGELYIVQNIVPSNDFNKQRCYSSTPLTKFEMLEVTAKWHFWQEVRAYVKDVLLPYHEKNNFKPSTIPSSKSHGERTWRVVPTCEKY
uniref:Uncharacterized protein n=1 Tax=Magallana gigas TaxID=29159 RepID=K1R6A6_MAGGI